MGICKLVPEHLRTDRLSLRVAQAMLSGQLTAFQSDFVDLSVEFDRGALSSPSTRTRILFVGLCAYIVSQGFSIPICALGPSWAIWPLLSDAALVVMFLGWFVAPRQRDKGSRVRQTVFNGLLAIMLLCLVSFAWMALVNATSSFPSGEKGVSFGLFQLFRMMEFLAVYFFTSSTPLSRRRVAILDWITAVTLLFACTSIVLTYCSVISPSYYCGHLPDSELSGPWIPMIEGHGQGLGTLGYNHAYVASQIVFLLGLRLILNAGRPSLPNIVLLFLSILCVALTGARNGLAIMLLFGMSVVFSSYSMKAVIVISLSCLSAALLGVVLAGDTLDSEQHVELLERLSTTKEFYKAENLAGRDSIWSESVDDLNKHPYQWIVGGGFGSAIDHIGSNAHNLPIQIISELGLVGLLTFAAMMKWLLKLLWTCVDDRKVLFLLVSTLLIGSMTQENFYPVPASGHCLGLFFCILAIDLRWNYRARRASTKCFEETPGVK